MNTKKILAATLLALGVSAANAGGFDGPFVQLGIGAVNTTAKLKNDSNGFDQSPSDTSFNGIITAGWSQSIGDAGFNLAANLFYVIGEQKSGSKNYVINDTYGQSVGNVSSKLDNTFGISIEPGWNFTDSTLGYVKLAWVNSSAKGHDNGSYSEPGYNSAYSYNTTADKTVNGFGYGLGVKQLLTKNIYAAVDLMGVEYSSGSIGDGGSIKPRQFMGFASIGYKF